MNKLWLNKKRNEKCILFFNGWGMDKNAVKHIAFDNYDICMYYNYNHLNKLKFNSNEYNEVYLIAWSLGVWAASKSINLQELSISKAISINGTETPKNELHGIHPTIFENTIKNWNDRSRDKFNLRILGGKEEFVKMNHALISRSCVDQKEELESINKRLIEGKLYEINYDCSIIGENDLIFLPTNQINYWNGKSRIVQLEIPHYPFNNFTSWNQIINI